MIYLLKTKQRCLQIGNGSSSKRTIQCDLWGALWRDPLVKRGGLCPCYPHRPPCTTTMRGRNIFRLGHCSCEFTKYQVIWHVLHLDHQPFESEQCKYNESEHLYCSCKPRWLWCFCFTSGNSQFQFFLWLNSSFLTLLLSNCITYVCWKDTLAVHTQLYDLVFFFFLDQLYDLVEGSISRLAYYRVLFFRADR